MPNNKRRNANRQIIANHKQHCKLCGTKKELTFHHRDPSTKAFEIHNSVRNRYSKTPLLNEIAKCDVLCRECHTCVHDYIGLDTYNTHIQTNVRFLLRLKSRWREEHASQNLS